MIVQVLNLKTFRVDRILLYFLVIVLYKDEICVLSKITSETQKLLLSRSLLNLSYFASTHIARTFNPHRSFLYRQKLPFSFFQMIFHLHVHTVNEQSGV